MAALPLTLSELRPYISRVNRISVCMLETSCYQNFDSILDVPHSYDEKHLYGIGGIESEFKTEGSRIGLLPCIEIVLSEQPRGEDT